MCFAVRLRSNKVNGMREHKITKSGRSDHSIAEIKWNFIKFDMQVLKLVSPGRTRHIVKAMSKSL